MYLSYMSFRVNQCVLGLNRVNLHNTRWCNIYPSNHVIPPYIAHIDAKCHYMFKNAEPMMKQFSFLRNIKHRKINQRYFLWEIEVWNLFAKEEICIVRAQCPSVLLFPLGLHSTWPGSQAEQRWKLPSFFSVTTCLLTNKN